MQLYTIFIGILYFLTFQASAVRVPDGDTIVVLIKGTEQKVRLAGIDCPEIGQPFSKQAKNFTMAFCKNKQLIIESKGKDQYGRYLGLVSVNGHSLNEALLKAGLAWQYKYDHNNQYGLLQNEAKGRKIGLWSDKNPVNPYLYRKNKKSYRKLNKSLIND